MKPPHTTLRFQPKPDDRKLPLVPIPQAVIDIAERCKAVTNDRYLRLPSVLEKIGRAKATIYNDVNKGIFPPPITVSQKVSAWKESEVNAWMEATTFSSRNCKPIDMTRFVSMLISSPTAAEPKVN